MKINIQNILFKHLQTPNQQNNLKVHLLLNQMNSNLLDYYKNILTKNNFLFLAQFNLYHKNQNIMINNNSIKILLFHCQINQKPNLMDIHNNNNSSSNLIHLKMKLRKSKFNRKIIHKPNLISNILLLKVIILLKHKLVIINQILNPMNKIQNLLLVKLDLIIYKY